MNTFRDCLIAKKYKGRDGTEKTNWIKIGRLTHNPENGNITIFLDALPANGESIIAPKPKPRQGDYSQPSQKEDFSQPDSTPAVNLEDIPF